MYKRQILDETDSGLDIDALRIVATGVTKLHRADNATVVITHYQRLLDYIVPDVVHVLYKGCLLYTSKTSYRLHQSQDAFGIAAVLEPFALAPDHLERVVDPSAGIGCELEEVTGLVVGLRNDLPLRHGDGQPDALALPLHGVVFGEVAPEEMCIRDRV